MGAYLGESALGENTVNLVSSGLNGNSNIRKQRAEKQGSCSKDLHEQTGFTAGTIADNDELLADLGHLDEGC